MAESKTTAAAAPKAEAAKPAADPKRDDPRKAAADAGAAKTEAANQGGDPKAADAGTKDDGGPAYPVNARRLRDQGMSVRDCFALGLATGILAGSPQMVNMPSELASRAYGLAEAMIRHRELIG